MQWIPEMEMNYCSGCGRTLVGNPHRYITLSPYFSDEIIELFLCTPCYNLYPVTFVIGKGYSFDAKPVCGQPQIFLN